jgi:hypothetical protein
MKKYKLKNKMIYKNKMLKLSLGILFIVALFEPTIQQYSDAYCAKYVATFPLTMEACIDSSNANNETSILYKIMNKTNVIIESYPNNNCSGSGIFTLTYSPNICKNKMIISPIIPVVSSNKENLNEYIVLNGSNFASEQKKNIVKSLKIQKKVLISEEIIKNIKSSQLALSEFFFTVSAFLFTFTFFILLVE